mmetsp:Transcript_22917/g.48727  ORF Transcript_22917/g.48727 Transcript_22917/m.48727 type:complete len:206 (-) Transcript_22917:1648-2265(-)
MIETKVALCKKDRPPLIRVEVPKRWKNVGVVLHDVAEGMIVVSNGVTAAVPMVRLMLRLTFRQNQGHLHDIVDGGECEQGDQALLVDHQLFFRLEDVSSASLLKQTGIDEEFLEKLPLRIVFEVESLVRLGHSDVGGCCNLKWSPLIIDTKRKSVPAIRVQSKKPVDCKESSDCPLILIADGTARANRAAAVRPTGILRLEQIQV